MASSSSVILESKHDVFLSFRGEDTRENFTGHLYAALCRKQVVAFIDDDGLKRGDEISPALSEAIEESKLSVIIFSKNYASSTWCLDEVAKIIECKNTHDQIVVPVFYHVDPSHVRKQMGSFADAFRKHERRFKEMPERVQRWRGALTEAASISGWDLRVIRSESKLVDEILQDILKKLNDLLPLSDNNEGLVGIDSRIDYVKSLLLESKVVGIWGMGGIGKTTIAEAVYNRIFRQFDGCCFIRNFREELEEHHGRLVHLQEKIISRILGEGNLVIDTLNTIPQFIKNRIQRLKVLIVLDDVDKSEQLKLLIRGLEPLGAKSRIIITTRDKQVLSSFGVNKIYEAKEFNHNEALLLFCMHAFKQNHPLEEFKQLSRGILGYAKGNPLALEVLGSSLYGKNKEEWGSVMHNLEMIVDTQIHDLLKISFDGLNEIEKNIFLDIACFFKGKNKDYVVNVLEGYYEPMLYCLHVLMDKSLIKISNNLLQMHDLLQEMGRQIVYKEHKKKPGKRTRLWHHEDIYHVLQYEKGTDAVEVILLDLSRTKEMHLSSKAFVNMVNLRLLKFYRLNRYSIDSTTISKVHLPQCLNYLPDELRYLHWEGYPSKTLPSKFSPKNLVALKLPYSNIEQLGDKMKHASNLKLIDLHGSEHLIDFPNISNASRLKVIDLEGCKRLVKVPSSIQHFSSLQWLNMRHCDSLRSISRNIHFTSPIIVDLSYCFNLKKFPQISGNVKVLYLSNTAIEEVPTSIASLTELVILEMNECTNLKRISTSICKLRSLSWLNLSYCSKLERFPEIMEEMKYLRDLKLNGTAIKELPSSIGYLSGLNFLQLEDCENLESLPTSIKQLSKLRFLDLSRCSMLQSVPELPLRLFHLHVDKCERLHSLLESPSKMKQFYEGKFKIPRCIIFDFQSCLNLNQNISQQRVEHMATALELYYEKANRRIPKFTILLHGSEIPEWFNHQSIVSSITIEVPQYCCKRRLKGFASCAIITLDGAFVGSPQCPVCVRCVFSYANCNKYITIAYFINNSMKSDHNRTIGIGFTPWMDVRLPDDYSTTVTFDFKIKFVRGAQPLYKLERCGVCPIYEELNMGQANTSAERFTSTNEEFKETTLFEYSEKKIS